MLHWKHLLTSAISAVDLSLTSDGFIFLTDASTISCIWATMFFKKSRICPFLSAKVGAGKIRVKMWSVITWSVPMLIWYICWISQFRYGNILATCFCHTAAKSYRLEGQVKCTNLHEISPGCVRAKICTKVISYLLSLLTFMTLSDNSCRYWIDYSQMWRKFLFSRQNGNVCGDS